MGVLDDLNPGREPVFRAPSAQTQAAVGWLHYRAANSIAQSEIARGADPGNAIRKGGNIPVVIVAYTMFLFPTWVVASLLFMVTAAAGNVIGFLSALLLATCFVIVSVRTVRYLSTPADRVLVYRINTGVVVALMVFLVVVVLPACLLWSMATYQGTPTTNY